MLGCYSKWLHRFHGQWRVEGNGGRVSALSDVQSREKWLFAVKARLGVVDGWLRQNGGRPYSRHLFEAMSNPILLTVSPRRNLWDLDPDEDVLQFYDRLVDILNVPVSGEWLQSVDTLLSSLAFRRWSTGVDTRRMLSPCPNGSRSDGNSLTPLPCKRYFDTCNGKHFVRIQSTVVGLVSKTGLD